MADISFWRPAHGLKEIANLSSIMINQSTDPLASATRLGDRCTDLQAEIWNQLLATHSPEDAAARLIGPFAVWGQDPLGRTVMAVDRFATKSLCWRVIDSKVMVASRADHLADAQTPLSTQAIFDYLYFHVIPSPRTIFEGIQRLRPGHVAVFDKGRVTERPYWTPRFLEPRTHASFDSLRAEFRGLLQRAVERQLDGGQAACFLSGGTDSSTVVGMVAQSGRRPITYSIGFEAEGYDEMAYARIAARHFGADHHEYYVTPDDLVATVPHVAAAYDQPFGNSSVLPAFHCARVARDNGAMKMLAGDGGDELFGGNSRYAKQALFNVYRQLPGVLRRGIIEPLLGRNGQSHMALLRKAASYLEQAREPMPDRLAIYNLLQRLGLTNVLTPGFLATVNPEAPIDLQRQVWDSAQTDSTLNRTLAFDWRFTLADCDLPKVWGATSLAGVLPGFPMLDSELVDFSMRLPSQYKLKGQQLRWFFKEALVGFLPDEILTKKKQGFGLPFGVWMTRHAGLRALANDSLNTLADRGVVRSDFIRELLTEHLMTHPGYYGEMVWILMMLEQWLRAHRPDYKLQH